MFDFNVSKIDGSSISFIYYSIIFMASVLYLKFLTNL